VAVVFRTATNFTAGNVTSISGGSALAKPPSTVVGDLVVALLYLETAGVTEAVASTGDTWTHIAEAVNTATTPDIYLNAWYTVVANATSTVAFTWGGGSFWADAALYRFDGQHASTILDVAVTTNSGNSANETGLGLASGTAGRHLVLMTANFSGNARTNGSWTSPLAERNDSENVAMASGDDAAGNDTANKSSTITAEQWATIMMAIRAADGGGAPTPAAMVRRLTRMGVG
jgi:hypothetical protein